MLDFGIVELGAWERLAFKILDLRGGGGGGEGEVADGDGVWF